MNIQINKYSIGLTVQKSKGLNDIIKATQNIRLIHSVTFPGPGTEGFRTEEPSHDLWTHETHSLEDKDSKILPRYSYHHCHHYHHCFSTWNSSKKPDLLKMKLSFLWMENEVAPERKRERARDLNWVQNRTGR